jgi:WD40 repeat protein
VASAPDGTWLASAGNDGSVRMWDTTTDQPRTTNPTRPTNEEPIGSDGPQPTTGGDGSVRIWSKTIRQHRAILTGHTDWARAVAIAPDGTWLASAGNDGSVRIWDATTGRHRATLTSRNNAITALAIAPDGIWLATTSDDGSVRIWNPATRTAVAFMRIESPANACTWSPCGRWVIVGGQAGLYRFDFRAPSS